VDGLFACGARVNPAALGDGLKVPMHIRPLAWAGRKAGVYSSGYFVEDAEQVADECG